jgi:hypothetical protein
MRVFLAPILSALLVTATDWHALKTRAHDDWIRLSSK